MRRTRKVHRWGFKEAADIRRVFSTSTRTRRSRTRAACGALLAGAYIGLPDAQFRWLPWESQCQRCCEIKPRLRRPESATLEMRTSVESFVLAIYRLTVPIDEHGTRRFAHERCFFRLDDDCSCGAFTWLGWGWRSRAERTAKPSVLDVLASDDPRLKLSPEQTQKILDALEWRPSRDTDWRCGGAID